MLREAWRLGEMTREDLERAIDLPAIRGDRLRPKLAIDTADIERLLATCARDQSPRGIRDLAILSILYAAGLRRAELVAVDLETRPQRRVDGMGKGARWRTAYLTIRAQQAVKAWRELRGHQPGAFFLAIHRSGRLLPGRLSSEAIARIVRRRAENAQINGLRPHDLRRAMTTHSLEAGADVLVVQKMLGHRSVSTTQTYDRRGDAATRHAVGLSSGDLVR